MGPYYKDKPMVSKHYEFWKFRGARRHDGYSYEVPDDVRLQKTTTRSLCVFDSTDVQITNCIIGLAHDIHKPHDGFVLNVRMVVCTH